MDTITIPIPEGMPDDQRRDLEGWLSKQVREITGGKEAIDSDPKVQADIAQRIREGIAAADAGDVFTSEEARKRLDAHLGITRG